MSSADESVPREVDEEWFEEREDALLEVLREMTTVYAADNEPVDVKFSPRNFSKSDGSFVSVNPYMPLQADPPVEGPHVLRVLTDTLSHEVCHIDWTPEDALPDFLEHYPGMESLASRIFNLLEDEYNDAERMRRWFGMRKKRAFYVWLVMNTEEWSPPVTEVESEDGLTMALLCALHQFARAGYVKDLDEADPVIAEFCSYVEPLLERIRTAHSWETRERLFHVVMQLFIRYAPDVERFDEEEWDDGPGETVSGKPESSSSYEDAEVDLDPATEEAIEELLKELLESGEFPLGEKPEESDGGSAETGESEESDVDDDADSPSGGSDLGEEESEGAGEESGSDSGEFLDVDPEAYERIKHDRDIEKLLETVDPGELKVVN